MKKIEITCNGNRTVSIDTLQNFQGNLKELRKPELEKLKRQILKHGFSFPVFVWGGDKILDGHQRIFTVRELITEGYMIDDIPVVDIDAKSKKDAAEKLLALNSRYAKITDEGLYEFIDANELDLSEFAGDLNLPEIDMAKFCKGWGEEQQEIPEAENNYASQFGVIVMCESESHQAEVYEMLNGQGYQVMAANNMPTARTKHGAYKEHGKETWKEKDGLRRVWRAL